MLGDELEAAMLALGVAAVGLEQEGHRSPVAVRVGERYAQPEQECEPVGVEGLARPHHRIGIRARPHGLEHLRRLDLALQAGAIEAALEVRRAEAAEHGDDPGAPQIRGVRHRRPQLLATPRAFSWRSWGWLVTSSRTASTSSRQIASVIRQARISRGQLGSP